MAEQWTGHNGQAAISEDVKSPQPAAGDQLNFLVGRRQAVTSAAVSSEELDRVKSWFRVASHPTGHWPNSAF